MNEELTKLIDGISGQNVAMTRNLGPTIKACEAYSAYKEHLSWWRKILWPWLTRKEKTHAILVAVLSLKKEKQNEV